MPLLIYGYDGNSTPTLDNKGYFICSDCSHFEDYFVTSVYPYLPFEMQNASSTFLQAGQAKCEGTDPDVCDFIYDIQKSFSVLSIFVLICLCGLFGRILFNHLHKTRIQRLFYEHRLTCLERGNPKRLSSRFFIIKTIRWFCHISSIYIYPSWFFCGTSILILTRRPITRNLILVPVQVALVTSILSVIFYFCEVLIRSTCFTPSIYGYDRKNAKRIT